MARSSYLLLYLSSCFQQCSGFLHLYERNGPRPGYDMGTYDILKVIVASTNPVIYTAVSIPSSSEIRTTQFVRGTFLTHLVIRSYERCRVSARCSRTANATTNQSSLGLVEWNHMSTRPVSFRVLELFSTISPSFVHDDKSNVPRGEPVSACAPHATSDLLRVFCDPGNGFSRQEFSLEHAFEFFQPALVADVVANAVCESLSSMNAPT